MWDNKIASDFCKELEHARKNGPRPKALQPLQWWCSSMSVHLHLKMALPERDLLPQKSSMAWQEKWDVEGASKTQATLVSSIVSCSAWCIARSWQLPAVIQAHSPTSPSCSTFYISWAAWKDGKPTVILGTAPNFLLESLQSRLTVAQQTGWCAVMCHILTPREFLASCGSWSASESPTWSFSHLSFKCGIVWYLGFFFLASFCKPCISPTQFFIAQPALQESCPMASGSFLMCDFWKYLFLPENKMVALYFALSFLLKNHNRPPCQSPHPNTNTFLICYTFKHFKGQLLILSLCLQVGKSIILNSLH